MTKTFLPIKSLCIAFILLIGVLALPAESKPEQGGWIQLFNGKDLSGWKIKIRGHELSDNFGNTFRVEDGVMKVAYDQYDEFKERFGHIFYSQSYSNYIIRVEYRFVGEQAKGGPGWAIRNSGIMIHGQDPETMTKDQDFPVSVEVQLLGGTGTGTRSTSNICTPGTHVVIDGKLVKRHCTNSTSKTYHGDQWVTAEVEVHGNRLIRNKVNGETVFEISQPQLDPGDPNAARLIKDNQVMLHGGSISLQSESHPVEFRKVELKVLPED